MTCRVSSGSMASRTREPRTATGDPRPGPTGGEPAIDRAVALWKRHETRLLSLVHVGGDGRLKGLDFAPRDADHVRAILRGGERADGSSLFARSGIKTEASDVLLRPRPDRDARPGRIVGPSPAPSGIRRSGRTPPA